MPIAILIINTVLCVLVIVPAFPPLQIHPNKANPTKPARPMTKQTSR